MDIKNREDWPAGEWCNFKHRKRRVMMISKYFKTVSPVGAEMLWASGVAAVGHCEKPHAILHKCSLKEGEVVSGMVVNGFSVVGISEEEFWE